MKFMRKIIVISFKLNKITKSNCSKNLKNLI